jgi:hypothetical protein
MVIIGLITSDAVIIVIEFMKVPGRAAGGPIE